MKRKQRDSLSRRAMKLLCSLLGVILVVMLGASFAFHHLLGKINYTDAALERPDVLSAFSEMDLTNLSSESAGPRLGSTDSPVVNILLVGQDRREGEKSARSDSMILCTFHKQSHRLTMTSFLRDLYVEIPGHHDNRINAAYSLGGTKLLKKTIEENFDLNIHGCVEVDFRQFSDIIDLLGGVRIELRQDEADTINRETGSALTEGTHILTGDQALTYSRIRNLDRDGDFSRTNRQRKVMSALFDTYRQAKLSALIPTLGELLPMITTDMNYGQILLLALELMPSLSDAQIVSQRVPADGTFTDQTIDGMSVLVADMEKARTMLHKSLLGE